MRPLNQNIVTQITKHLRCIVPFDRRRNCGSTVEAQRDRLHQRADTEFEAAGATVEVGGTVGIGTALVVRRASRCVARRHALPQRSGLEPTYGRSHSSWSALSHRPQRGSNA